MRARLSHPWVTFAALSLLFFLVSAGTFSSLGVVLPAMVRELRWNWGQAGLGYTFLGLACGLSSLAPAALIRRVGVRGTIAVGALLLMAGFAALALGHSVRVYLAATLVIGLAFALTATVPGTHVLTGLFARRSAVLGAYFTIGALGGVAGPLLYVGVVSATHQWRDYWWLFVAGAGTLGGFAAAAAPARIVVATGPGEALPNDAPSAGADGHWTVARALRTPQFYVIVGAYTMYLLINTTAHGFAVEHLIERGVAAKVAAGMLSLEALIGAAVTVVGGLVGERVRPKILLVISLIALIGGMTSLAEARDVLLMLGYAVGVGVGFGLSLLSSTLLLINYFGRRANLELYSSMCLLSTAAALGPAFGGRARDTLGSFTVVFLLCALATFLMLIATVLMTPPVAKPDAHSTTAVPNPPPDRDAADARR